MDQKNKMRVLTLLSFFGMLIFGTGMFYSPMGSSHFVGKAVLTVLFAFLCVMCWLKMRNLKEKDND